MFVDEHMAGRSWKSTESTDFGCGSKTSNAKLQKNYITYRSFMATQTYASFCELPILINFCLAKFVEHIFSCGG